jgi:hypothetical protein
MTDTTTSFQSSWTLAEALIFEIASHLRIGRSAWLVGNLEKYYWEFETIVRVLKGMLDKTEKDEANKQEEEITKCFKEKLLAEDRKKLSGLLKKYDELVMTFLHKHKLDVPQKKDRKRLVA